MENTAPQTPAGKANRLPSVPALLLFLFAIGVPSVAGIALAKTITDNPWKWVLIGLAYECCIGILGFIGKVWQKLEGNLVNRTASWIEMSASLLISRSWRRYRNYVLHEHEVFDIKGLTTHPGRDLELEQVFVQLDVNPTPVHQASADPLKVPEVLREGSHHIWSYLADRTLRSRHFVIIGAPGSGKTTLLKHLALCLARHRRAGVQRIPVLLYLRDYATLLQEKYDASTDTFAYSLAEAVNTHIQRKWQQSLPLSWIKGKLTKGKCLVLLDGLDEVASDSVRQLVIKWVQAQMLAYRGNRFLLTSRPYGYRDNPLEGVWVLETRPFTPVQVAQFVRNWYRANEYKSWGRKDAGMQMRAREGADDLLSRLYRAPALLAFAVNPLLLTMIATVHRYRGSLPGSRVALYAEICEVFLGKRRKAIGVAEELTPAQMLQVLRPLAYAFMQQGEREMKLEDACQIITPHLLDVSTEIEPDEFLRMVQNSSGLLLERNPGLYGFAHKTFQEYLTAAYITKEERFEQELVARVHNDWWHETIRLYCAQTDATAIVRACLVNDPPTASALALALDCVEEKHTIKPAVKEQLDALLEKGREDPDLERRQVIAQALLSRRLDKMVHLHDEVFVDTSFVTCAEYQLFLDESLTYHQPDHWSARTFPQGQGHLALLGMRPADVKAFCQWLTERDAGVWQYRMPTTSEHRQIKEKLQGTYKLDAERGYWVDEGRAVVWVDGKTPWFELQGNNATLYPFPLNIDLDSDIDLVHNIDLYLNRDIDRDIDLARSLARYLARYLDLASDIDFVHNIDPYLDIDSDIDFDHAYFLARSLDHALDIARTSTSIFDLVHDIASASDSARYLDLDITSDLVHASARASDIARLLVSIVTDMVGGSRPMNVLTIVYLARALVYSRALARVLSLLVSPHPRRRWRWLPQYKKTDETDEQLRWSIYSALNLYIDLLIINERKEGRLPAWEGILLVKERKQTMPANMGENG